MQNSLAVVFEAPGQVALRALRLAPETSDEVEVDVEFSGISTGTERLLFTGRMPPFPGMGYPLVPGYETVGRARQADPEGRFAAGDRVFVPGASCFGEVRGLFGGAASRLRASASRLTPIDESLGERGVLLALAATAEHALAAARHPPDLIVGHGVLGRVLARLAVARGGAPVVWEKNPDRLAGARGYEVCGPDADPRRGVTSAIDVSGDPGIVDALVPGLAPGGEIVLAGFYGERLDFGFPLAFMKEIRLRIAAEWKPGDLDAVLAHLAAGRLDLDDLITHRRGWDAAPSAYETAFNDASCLKMVLDWRGCE